jgi:hypothetical protein
MQSEEIFIDQEFRKRFPNLSIIIESDAQQINAKKDSETGQSLATAPSPGLYISKSQNGNTI